MPGHSRSKNGFASLAYVAGIHVLKSEVKSKTWMAGTSPAMTKCSRGLCALHSSLPGEDPAIYAEPHFSMDHRVKPGGDE